MPVQSTGSDALELDDVLSWARLIAGILCAFAGVIHLGYADAHFGDRHDVGAFFVVVGVAQLAASWFLIYGPPSLYVTLGTICGLLGVMATYVVSRTAGLPVGPTPGVAESAGLLDLVSVLVEAMAVALLTIVALGDFARFRQRSESRAYGLALLGGGIALMFLGLGLDTLMLERDPDSQIGQRLVEISNPAHLMMIAGLVLAAAGLIRAMTAGLQSTSAPSQFLARPGLAAFALVVLLGATGGLAASTGDGHGHGHAEGATAHDGPADHHTKSEEALESDPTYQMLKATLEKQGTSAALDQLERLAAADSAILGDGHPLAHALGRFSFTHYGSASKAFGQCKELFQSGCYHGVLEAYFIANPDFTGQDVAGLCATLVTGNQTTFVKFQCVHGLGHGLTMYFEHDIFDALKYCDYLPTTWDRESCYGGVFMENIVFYQTKDSGAHGDHADHETFLDPADPLYPCNAVGQRYLYQCYLMQTSAILTFNGYDFAKAFTTCGKVEQAFIPICYQSLGRDISGYTLRDTDKSLFLCALDKGEYMKHCIVGVVKNFIDVTWTTDQAYDFCRKAAEETKEACYTAIGEQLLGLQPDPGARAADCAKSEERYLSACRAAARV